jgi:hypothetical protein
MEGEVERKGWGNISKTDLLPVVVGSSYCKLAAPKINSSCYFDKSWFLMSVFQKIISLKWNGSNSWTNHSLLFCVWHFFLHLYCVGYNDRYHLTGSWCVPWRVVSREAASILLTTSVNRLYFVFLAPSLLILRAFFSPSPVRLHWDISIRIRISLYFTVDQMQQMSTRVPPLQE